MILKVVTKKGKTEITDERGNAFATLYGVKRIDHDGAVLISPIEKKGAGEKPGMRALDKIFPSSKVGKERMTKGKRGRREE